LTIDEPKAAPAIVKAGRLMSKEDQEKVRKAIQNAKSMEEVRKLERSLREGYMPDLDSVGA
jgi:U2 small nuclear ribonucleoprotein A'